jgi:Asp-tRNA(Asn)/Glu-tRNA(Gln) amidotransferase A subunit family amidase
MSSIYKTISLSQQASFPSKELASLLQRRTLGQKLLQVRPVILGAGMIERVQLGLVKAWAKAIEILKEAGVQVEELDLPSTMTQADLWHKIILHSEGRASFLGDYATGKEHLSDFIHEQAENRLGWTKKQLVDAYDGLAELRRTFDAIAGQYDAVLVPSVLDEAPVGVHHTGSLECTFLFDSVVTESPLAVCGTWTILHTPVINLPGFQGSNGMPIGPSLTAPRFHDQHLLYVAEPISKLFAEQGGWHHKLF